MVVRLSSLYMASFLSESKKLGKNNMNSFAGQSPPSAAESIISFSVKFIPFDQHRGRFLAENRDTGLPGWI